MILNQKYLEWINIILNTNGLFEYQWIIWIPIKYMNTNEIFELFELFDFFNELIELFGYQWIIWI